jgi:hypothetical protein
MKKMILLLVVFLVLTGAEGQRGRKKKVEVVHQVEVLLVYLAVPIDLDIVTEDITLVQSNVLAILIQTVI